MSTAPKMASNSPMPNCNCRVCAGVRNRLSLLAAHAFNTSAVVSAANIPPKKMPISCLLQPLGTITPVVMPTQKKTVPGLTAFSKKPRSHHFMYGFFSGGWNTSSCDKVLCSTDLHKLLKPKASSSSPPSKPAHSLKSGRKASASKASMLYMATATYNRSLVQIPAAKETPARNP